MCYPILLSSVEPNRREVNDILHLTPNDARSLNITKLLSSYGAAREPAGLKSSTHIKRIIRSLEEMEDEDSSGSINGSGDRGTAADENGMVFSGDLYERNSESMNFRMEEDPSGEGDWEGGPINQSGDEQDDDATDDIIQSETHGVTAVKRTEMASVIDPREIEEVKPDSDNLIARAFQVDLSGNQLRLEQSSGESDQGEENAFGFSSASGASGAEVLLSDDIQGQGSSGSGHINKTIMREVQRNLHKVWRYASSGKNLDMVSKGPKGKEEAKKIREIYNLVIKHESRSSSSSDQGRKSLKEAVSGDAGGYNDEGGFNDEYSVSGESGDESEIKHENGSANDLVEEYEVGSAIYVENEENEGNKLAGDDVSGEHSGQADALDVSEGSASGSGTVNKNLLKEVEHNLHSVWRYAAPKKDLDMVARGPKGEEEEQKVKKIYNIVSKHESGSAFIDFELRKKEKSVDDSVQTRKHSHRHKSRESRVKITKIGLNATEAKLYKLQKARKYTYNKNLKRLKPWGMGMGKDSSARKPGGTHVKRVGGNGKTGRNRNDHLALLGEEMKELAPSDENDNIAKDKEKSKAKLEKDETKEKQEKETSKQPNESENETHREKNKSKGQKVVLVRQKPFDITQLEVGRKLEEMILRRMVELETQRLGKKLAGKQAHLKDSKLKEKEDDADRDKGVPKGG